MKAKIITSIVLGFFGLSSFCVLVYILNLCPESWRGTWYAICWWLPLSLAAAALYTWAWTFCLKNFNKDAFCK